MIYTIENEYLTVSVEDIGAQLKSIYHKKSETEFLWQGDPKYWKGRAYNLFPIVGRLYDGKYTYNGKTYELERHGFARDKKFYLCEKSGEEMTFNISSDDETLPSYPFRFIFKITFKLEKNKLIVSYSVQNTGEEKMYFGLGAHPGFNVPFAGGKFEDYEIRFDAPCKPLRELLGETYLMADKTVPFDLDENFALELNHSLFDDDAVVLRNTSGSLTLEKKGEKKGVKVEYSDMPFVGIWHAPKTDAPYVCIEPWANLPSKEGQTEDLTKKENIGVAEAGETVKTVMSITIL